MPCAHSHGKHVPCETETAYFQVPSLHLHNGIVTFDLMKKKLPSIYHGDCFYFVLRASSKAHGGEGKLIKQIPRIASRPHKAAEKRREKQRRAIAATFGILSMNHTAVDRQGKLPGLLALGKTILSHQSASFTTSLKERYWQSGTDAFCDLMEYIFSHCPLSTSF